MTADWGTPPTEYDPLFPQQYRDWRDFFEQVVRPIVEDPSPDGTAAMEAFKRCDPSFLSAAFYFAALAPPVAPLQPRPEQDRWPARPGHAQDCESRHPDWSNWNTEYDEPHPKPCTCRFDRLVGLDEGTAKAVCRANHVPCRVLERNGNPLVVTRDVVPGRVNLKVAGGLVTEVTVG